MPDVRPLPALTAVLAPFSSSSWFDRVAVRHDGFGFPGDPNVHVPWESITLVGAAREIDIMALSDVFFWAIVCDPIATHLWIPMPVESGLSECGYREFEDQLMSRGLAAEPPPVSEWHRTGKGYDRSYLSFCTYPAFAFGQPVYQFRRTGGFLSLPRLFTVVPTRSTAVG